MSAALAVAPEAGPSLHVEGVSRRFGGLQAVRDLTLTVAPGRVTGLIGPNGAGKTTALNLITGLLRLDSGTVRLGAHDLSRLPPAAVARMGIARTFQNIRLLPEMTVLENILAGFAREDATSFAAKLVGLPAVRRQTAAFRARAEAVAARFGLAPFLRRLAGELAYGHQRRVEICRAVVLSPSVLLLDEPAAGMNDVEAEDLGRHIRALARDGVAVLLIEHNMRLVMSLCDDIYVLASGAIIAAGSPAQVQAEPAVIDAYLGH